jgi:hypothetical protein
LLLAGDEHHLQAGSVRSVADFLDPEARCRERLFDLVLVSEAQGRFGDQPGTVGFEDIDRPERDQRQGDPDQLGPGMHDSHTRDVHPALGAVPGPRRPSPSARASGLEHQGTAGAQRLVGGGEHVRPVVVGEEDLSDVAGHGHQIHVSLRQRRRVAMDPMDVFGAGLGPAYGQGGGRWVQAGDGDAPAGQEAGECAGATADVQHALGAAFVDYPEVGVEVGAIGVEVVVDGSQAGVGETGVNHGRLRRRRRP